MIESPINMTSGLNFNSRLAFRNSERFGKSLIGRALYRSATKRKANTIARVSGKRLFMVATAVSAASTRCPNHLGRYGNGRSQTLAWNLNFQRDQTHGDGRPAQSTRRKNSAPRKARPSQNCTGTFNRTYGTTRDSCFIP